MNKPRFKDCIYAVPSGIIVYLLFLLMGYLPYFSVLDSNIETILPLCWIAAALVCFLSLMHKERSIRNCISRTIILFLTFLAVLVFNGSIGAIRFLNTNVLHIVVTEGNSRAAGLGQMFFLIPVVGFCILVNIGVIAHRLFKFVLKK